MASQITHIVYADKFLTSYPGKWERSKFLIGTIFPDIRYLGVIERDKTHTKGLNLKRIQMTTDPFIAGMQFHSWLDEFRGLYLVESGIGDYGEATTSRIRALKFFEDELCYYMQPDWLTVSSYFDDIIFDETEFLIPEDKLRDWHSINQNYFKTAPTKSSRIHALRGVGFSPETANDINREVEHMRADQGLIKLVLGFESYFDSYVRVD